VAAIAAAAFGVAAPTAHAREESPMPVADIKSFFEAGSATRVIAHRGFSGRAPENTLAAVRAAIELGADMVEVDVTLTADGHVVLMHDDTLDRTTDGTGAAMDATLEELRKLDAGSWFDPSFAGEPVPTLVELLELVTDKILLNIEIKHEAVTEVAEDGIAHKVDDLVAAHGEVDQVVVSSFDPRPLGHLRDRGSALATASLFNAQLHDGMLPSEVTAQVGSSAFNISGRLLDARVLADARAHRLPVAVYTVNDTKDMERLIEVGVAAMFTDHPDRLVQLLGR
ncbi:MAG: glycerophosphodiester phosphodiesterase family protein, partial [Acidobacteriota bacterium]